MCGRYFVDADDTERALSAFTGDCAPRNLPADGSALPKSGEIFPSDTVAVIANNRNRVPAVFLMQWGFPGGGRSRIINARSETAAEKPMFAESAQARRCLIPMTNYFEWSVQEDGKTKYAIRPAGSNAMYLCGLYRLYPELPLPVFVILTRPAAPNLLAVHDRMPLIIGEQNAAAWLSPDGRYQELLCCAVEQMELCQV